MYSHNHLCYLSAVVQRVFDDSADLLQKQNKCKKDKLKTT